MRILFTAATAEELHCAEIAYERISPSDAALLKVDFAVTGIGVAATCYHLTKILNPALSEREPTIWWSISVSQAVTRRNSQLVA